MTTRKLTKWLVLGVIAVLIAYDVVAYKLGGVDATISRVTLGWATDIPVVVFGAGVICGHLFWPQRRKDKTSRSQINS